MRAPLEDQSLKPFNTFGIDARARYLAAFETAEELEALLDWAASRLIDVQDRTIGVQKKGIIVLGGGSNVLLTHDVDALVLRNAIKGIGLVDEDEAAAEHFRRELQERAA